MQYFKPEGDLFVGDCMPFFHAGTFRLFYIRDENHHGALGGLGGHQRAQASSENLINWEHHPLAIPITEDREGSICTGSVFFHEGTYYGFYATRMRDWPYWGQWKQQLRRQGYDSLPADDDVISFRLLAHFNRFTDDFTSGGLTPRPRGPKLRRRDMGRRGASWSAMPDRFSLTRG